MPGVNTPQFDWVRNEGCGKRAQPVPPIYEPEVGAGAVYWVAHNDRAARSGVGWPTWKAIWGQKFIAGLLDRYLARVAYSGQMTDEDLPDRPDNLYETVKGDYAARGRFDSQANAESSELTLAKHPWMTGGALTGLAGAAVVAGAFLLGRYAQSGRHAGSRHRGQRRLH